MSALKFPKREKINESHDIHVNHILLNFQIIEDERKEKKDST